MRFNGRTPGHREGIVRQDVGLQRTVFFSVVCTGRVSAKDGGAHHEVLPLLITSISAQLVREKDGVV